jgi:tetratricopeptide (TPR) repeat protein
MKRALIATLLLAMPPTALWAAGVAKSGTVGDLRKRDLQLGSEVKVPGTAAKAMENYQRFLELQNTDPLLRAEALRRLGDLSLESGELERMTNEVTLVDIQGGEAIRLYGTLLKAYPDYARNDQVLYQLARAYETTGQAEKALATLDAIVQKYPKTRELGEVHFRRGELLFSAKRYADAQAAYEAVIDRGASGSAFYEQSLYKHGWSLFKQALNEESLPSFAKVLDLKLLPARSAGTARDLDKLARADRELVDDTLRVTSIAYSYLDGADTLTSFLKKRGEVPYSWLMYSRLGDLYVEKQRYQDAATTYRAYVVGHPIDSHAPSLSMQAIEAYRKGGFADLVVDGKTEYASTYGFSQPFWKGRQRADYPEVVNELKTNLKDLSQHFHATAQKSKRIEDYNVAAHWYRERLSSFPDDAESADTNYMLAEALFESRQFAEAATEYEHSAYQYPTGARSATAAYAALVAYKNQEELLPAADKAAWHARATDSGLKFAETFPAHPESAVVMTRAAEDLYAAKDSVRAVQVAEKLLARMPPVDLPKQRIAFTIIGQTAFNAAQFDKAETAFSSALSQTTPGQAERTDLIERLAESVYKQGEAKRTAGDDAGSANDFLRVAQLAPTSKVVPTARYDAAAALVKSKQWDRAIAVFESYRRDYPNSQYSKEITRNLAVAYVEAGKPAQAAVEFEAIAATPGEDGAVTREALTRAADLYETAGNSPRSISLLEQLVAKFPTPVADAVETRFRLAEAARKSGNSERLRYWRTEIVKADASAGAGRTDRTRFLAAGAKLELVQPLRDEFRAIKLTAPLKKSLAAKKRSLDVSMKAYQDVAAYNVASTTTAATFEMAELYHVLARDLMASERPRKLSADEREQYDSLLEEQAYPLEEQSITVHELNTVRTVDGVYDESVQKSFKVLAEMKPGRYGKVEQTTQIAEQAEAEETALRATTDKQPDNAVAWSELGVALRMRGKFVEARGAYEKALAVDPTQAAAHRNLGVLLDLYLNEPVAALPEFEKYRELSGEEKPVSGWIAELRARTGIKAPVPTPAPTAEPDAATPAAADATAAASAAPTTEVAK